MDKNIDPHYISDLNDIDEDDEYAFPDKQSDEDFAIQGWMD